MGKFGEQEVANAHLSSTAYLDQLRADIEQCAARLIAPTQPPPAATRGLDAALLAELGSELSAAWKKAGENARDLVSKHRTEFPDSPLFCACTLLGPIGQSRREICVTQVLAWLLDPSAEHGFDGLLLRAFLLMLREESEAARNILSNDDGDISVYTEFSLNQENRADIVITSKGSAVVIEAKIDAREGLAQTERYSRDFGRAFPTCTYVFLTPRGVHATAETFRSLRYLEIAKAIMPALRVGRTNEGFHYARYFVAGVLNELCGIRTSNDIGQVLQGNSFALESLLGEQSNG